MKVDIHDTSPDLLLSSQGDEDHSIVLMDNGGSRGGGLANSLRGASRKPLCAL